MRGQQAARTAFVQVRTLNSAKILHSYLSQFDSVAQIFHTEIGDKNYCLVEMASEQGLDRVLKSAFHAPSDCRLPLTSPLLWLNANGINKASLCVGDNHTESRASSIVPSHHINYDKLFSQLVSCETLDDQIKLHYSHCALDEVGSRLRFFTCHVLQRLLSGILSGVSVLPFGSSVNGFGSKNCDVDMVLRFGSESHTQSGPLRFHDVTVSKCNRQVAQSVLSAMFVLLSTMVPGNVDVRKILKARVPIIKYSNKLTGIDADLCMDVTGLRMSEILYTYCLLDKRVAPLVMAVRRWASLAKVTHEAFGFSGSGPFISNFGLSLLVIFYLQSISPPLIPPAAKLFRTDTAFGHLENAIHPDSLPASSNRQSLAELFHGLMRFLSNIDVFSSSLCVLSGQLHERDSHSSDEQPLFIHNPLDTTLNVCKNVSLSKLLHLTREAGRCCSLLNHSSHWRHVLIHYNMKKSSSFQPPSLDQLLSLSSDSGTRPAEREADMTTTNPSIFTLQDERGRGLQVSSSRQSLSTESATRFSVKPPLPPRKRFSRKDKAK